MQLTGLAGKTAVVVGAETLLGCAVAERLAAEGTALALVDLGGSEAGNRAAPPAGTRSGVRVHRFAHASSTDWTSLAARVTVECSRIDFLINAPGEPPTLGEPSEQPNEQGRALEQVDDTAWDEALAVHLAAVFRS